MKKHYPNTYHNTPTLDGLITIAVVLAPLAIGIIGILALTGNFS